MIFPKNIISGDVSLLRLQPASRTSHVSTLHPWRRNRNLVFHGIGEVVSPRTSPTLPPVGGEAGGVKRNATPPRGVGGYGKVLLAIRPGTDTSEPLHTHTAFLS